MSSIFYYNKSVQSLLGQVRMSNRDGGNRDPFARSTAPLLSMAYPSMQRSKRLSCSIDDRLMYRGWHPRGSIVLIKSNDDFCCLYWPLSSAQQLQTKHSPISGSRKLAKVEAGNFGHVETISAIVQIELFIARSILFAAHFHMCDLD